MRVCPGATTIVGWGRREPDEDEDVGRLWFGGVVVAGLAGTVVDWVRAEARVEDVRVSGIEDADLEAWGLPVPVVWAGGWGTGPEEAFGIGLRAKGLSSSVRR